MHLLDTSSKNACTLHILFQVYTFPYKFLDPSVKPHFRFRVDSMAHLQ